MKQRTVVFDLGGVVFNWQPLRLLQQVLPHLATDEASAKALAQNVFQTFAVNGDWAQFDLGLVEPDQLAERIARRTGLTASDVLTIIAAIPPHMSVQTGTVDLMRDLRDQGHRLVYLSNMPATYSDWIERDHDFFEWFEDGIFSARVQQMKPDPNIYANAVERFGLRGDVPVFIDDVQHNLDAAALHGWQGVRFESAPQVRAKLVEMAWLAG